MEIPHTVDYSDDLQGLRFRRVNDEIIENTPCAKGNISQIIANVPDAGLVSNLGEFFV